MEEIAACTGNLSKIIETCRLFKISVPLTTSFQILDELFLRYRKIPNVSPGLIEVFKHFLGGLYSGGLIFGGHFVLVSSCQDL